MTFAETVFLTLNICYGIFPNQNLLSVEKVRHIIKAVEKKVVYAYVLFTNT